MRPDIAGVRTTNGTVKTTGADNKIYAEVATFDAPTAGSYTVAVTTDGSLVAVAPALSTAAKGVAWFVAIIFGSLVAIVGVVLIIIGAARRSSSRTRPPGAPSAPPAAAPSV